MAEKYRGTGGKHARSVAELVGNVLEPVIARRAGMTLDLLKTWPELAGPEFSKTTRPEKIDWPRRANEDDPFQPATLVVACENSAALFFQHEQAVILERVNLFFGFQAIKRIRILQKPINRAEKPAVTSGDAPLSRDEEIRLSALLDEIDDPELKDVLAKLGRGVISRENTR